jgi:hypothetical protein
VRHGTFANSQFAGAKDGKMMKKYRKMVGTCGKKYGDISGF